MILSAEPMVNGDDRPVDVTDQAIAKGHVRDFPVAASPRVRQSGQGHYARGFTSRLAAKCLVREQRQLCMALADRRH